MNYLNNVVDYEDELSNMEDIGSGVMGLVRSSMKEEDFRKQEYDLACRVWN